jgi:outer membrane immunogenic protein
MKRLLTTAAVLVFAAGPTLAADLPTRKAPAYLPPPPPPPMWTGFYAGLNAGGNIGTNSAANVAYWGPAGFNPWSTNSLYPNPADGYIWPDSQAFIPLSGVGVAQSGVISNTQSGFVGGGQIGYNWQFGNYVVGLETDFQGATIRGAGSTQGAAVATNPGYSEPGYAFQDSATSTGATRLSAGVNWMGTVRGRLGFLVTPTLLVFGTGGLTYGAVHASATSYATTNFVESGYSGGPYTQAWATQAYLGGGSANKTLTGWNAGGGLEWMFMPNWSVKAEAIYWNMGNINLNTASWAGATSNYYSYEGSPSVPSFASVGTVRVNYQGVIVRAGVNYHFNWGSPGPVVAKY